MTRRILRSLVIFLAVLAVANAGYWVLWIHGERIAQASNGAPVDELIAEVRVLPINRDFVYMYTAPEGSLGFYCYRIAVFMKPRGGPPLSSVCVTFDSVRPQRSAIATKWLDEDTLQVDFGSFGTVEGDVGTSFESSWRWLASQ